MSPLLPVDGSSNNQKVKRLKTQKKILMKETHEDQIHGIEIQSEFLSQDTCMLEMELELLKREIELLKIRS